MSNTLVYSKVHNTDTVVSVNVQPFLKAGETLVSILLTDVTPVSTTPLTIDVLNFAPPSFDVNLQGGETSVSYGVPITLTTNARQIGLVLAVTVLADITAPFVTQNPDAYTDLIDTIEAGKSALGTAIFAFPTHIDPAGGYVDWEFLDSEGVIYASGNAFEYVVESNGITNTVISRAVINVPSDVPPSLQGQKYQLRYTLTLSSQMIQEYPTQSTYYSFENVTVIGLNTVPLGTQAGIEMQGDVATLSIVVDQLYDNVVLEIYQDNTLLGASPIADPVRVSSGYYYAGSIPTAALPVSLESYTVVWKYGNTATPNQTFRESAPLWIINATIMQAMDDMRAKISKARATLYGAPDSQFPASTLMTWLRRARDNFNGSYGVFTSFTMTNAKGAIREYWLMYAEIGALEAQYLCEGEKAFNFSGAAIQLDVDRTGFLDNAASKIQARLDSEFKPVKQVMVMRGATKGDGSVDPSRLQQGAIGTVGICITPASPWGVRGGYPYPGLR